MHPDESFVEQIRDVLSHLYDYTYLQTHPLTRQFQPANRPSSQARMRFLRSLVLETMEDMSPGPHVPFRSHRARVYNVLNLHYVEGLMVQEVGRELGISERQVYRDLRRAEQDLATLLWLRCPVVEELEKDHVQTEAILAEAERLRGKREELEVRLLLERALQAVTRLAEERGVRITLTITTKPLTIRINRTISRQVLVTVLSHAVQHANPEKAVTLSVKRKEEGAHLMVSYLASVEASEDWESSLTIPRQLVQVQSGAWEVSSDSAGRRLISFTLGIHSMSTVLVIDDNEGLIELFRRYLTGEGYRLIGASDGTQGLGLVEEHSPDVIVLDVMMPQQDGWEILQLLRNRRRTRKIPVLVCSVIDDPRLAYSLGAAEFLAKPVKREELLRALDGCRRWRTRARSHLAGPASTR